MTRRESKYVVAAKPVNRRAAFKTAPAAMSPVAQERALAAKARARLGAPLASQLSAAGRGVRAPLPKRAVAGGIIAACGGVGVVLGALTASPLAAAASAVPLLAGSLLAWRYRRRSGTGLPDAPLAPLLDAEAVAALDRAFEAVAHELPVALAQPLADLKLAIVRIARHPAAGTVDEHFTLEDRMYVAECVRRYVPDSLQSYLAVPKAQRSEPLAQGRSAEDLLASQLALLRGELEDREAGLARSASEALLRQQRFLQAKNR